MNKLVFLPPHSEIIHSWHRKLTDRASGWSIELPNDRNEALKVLPDADAIFGTLDPELLSVATKVRWIQAPAAAPPAGYYFKELIKHDVTVTNFRGIYNDHISVHILAMMLSLTKHLNIYRDQQVNRVWKPLESPTYHSTFLPSSTALIVGVGGIGEETARLCHSIGMTVIGVDERRQEKPEFLADMFSPDALDSQLEKADFVILTIPHTPKTEGLFDLQKFTIMKKSAFFINIGRGMTTNLTDLNKALIHGEIAGAALDVYEVEPLPTNHPLWDAPNIIITPHVAAQGGENIDERRYEIILENMRRFQEKENLLNIVDKANWY
ncbi:MAG: D-2-hydroxyacid dehydrogenase [Dehalococcoidia bacterium]|jgi:phosphoglycerate dehydrogenase-like enzyme|nr:D-2-hydroxyacid dehydrogenase [Dehalococcoidia bacterium]MDP6425926.1 D-2-hydroxyacid dehydrogenase [Dehalococcoidia bacterium]MDP7231310.1 D-2-hydroxyacid dehydrogenase [Dehalococcoidia bacterium]MDP7613632.1 D-2-hydroxyacid dehydrogenase [Dehalococcoidia bacterium]